MDRKAPDELAEKLKEQSAVDALKVVFSEFGNKAAIASSFGAEDQVLAHMAGGISKAFRIFTLDTERLPRETYDLIGETQEKSRIKIEIYTPDKEATEKMTREHGENLFRESIEKRKLCCEVRKIQPLKRALAGLEVWVTGLRREQAVTRADLQKVEWDEAHGLIKVNPLVEWTEKQVWDYIKENKVPYNKLHDKGYPSIGCASCTRAVKPGDDIRAGRWWWETPEQKECGLHVVGGKLVRRKTN